MERYEVLHDEPGLAHALDVDNTRERDPWRARFGWDTASGGVRRPYFYDNDGPRAACGLGVRVVLPQTFDHDDADSCPGCAELARSGKAWGRWRQPDPYRYDICNAVVRVEEDGESEAPAGVG